MKKAYTPSRRDRRRTEAREALYRAELRREQILDRLLRNAEHIKKLKRTLARLEKPDQHTGSVSVAEGKIIEEELVIATDVLFNDDISDVPPCK